MSRRWRCWRPLWDSSPSRCTLSHPWWRQNVTVFFCKDTMDLQSHTHARGDRDRVYTCARTQRWRCLRKKKKKRENEKIPAATTLYMNCDATDIAPRLLFLHWGRFDKVSNVLSALRIKQRSGGLWYRAYQRNTVLPCS